MIVSCFYCGVETTTSRDPLRRGFQRRTIDHVVPQSQGGCWIRGNAVIACRKCNQQKGDLTYEEFRVVWALRKQCVTVADTKIFAGELALPHAIRSKIPILLHHQAKVLLDNALAVMIVFVLTKLVRML